MALSIAVQGHARSLVRYGVAVAAVVLAWAAREAFTPLWGPTYLPFVFFYPAVVLAAWFGRARPALLAIGLSALTANWSFIEPRYSFLPVDSGAVAAVLSFALAGLCVVGAIEANAIARRSCSTTRRV
jgi:K+-sensing histidine kinase KdpD